MKTLVCTIVIATALLIAGVFEASAQKRLSSSPRTFQTFFAKFRNAVRRGDKQAVAEMTRFPFRYGFDAGDEGMMTRSEFIRRFDEIFGTSPGRFLLEKNPSFSVTDSGRSFVVSTEDAAHLMFVKSADGSFKFMSYMVEP